MALLCRVGGIGIGAISPNAHFPFCRLKSVAFRAVYLAVGGVGTLLGVLGHILFYKRRLVSQMSNDTVALVSEAEQPDTVPLVEQDASPAFNSQPPEEIKLVRKSQKEDRRRRVDQ